METKIESVRTELKADIARVEAKVDSIKTELDIKIGSLGKEVEGLRREVGVLGKEVEALKAEISKVKYDLVKWTVGALILNIGVVVGLVFAMFKLFLDK